MAVGVVVEAELNLTAVETGTKLVWTASIVERKGLLKAVSAGLIQGAAQRVVDDFWSAVQEALGSEGGNA